MHQGDKVHRTVRRLLFVTRATGAARDEQLGEHKTFLKASRWVYSRAATGRGAGCAGCPLTTRHTARTQREQLRERLSHALARAETTLTELRRERALEAEAGHSQTKARRSGNSCGDDRIRTQIDHLTRMTTETRRSRADECTIAGSRAEQSLTIGAERRLCTDLRGTDSNDEAVPATRKSGPYVARRNPRPCRRQGGQPSSGITDLHAQCLEGEESSSEWGWGLPDHA